MIFSKWFWDDPERYAARLRDIELANTTELDADIAFVQDTFEKLAVMDARERVKEEKEREKRSRWMESKRTELEEMGIDLGAMEREMGIGMQGDQ
jgi:hypothetical protein